MVGIDRIYREDALQLFSRVSRVLQATGAVDTARCNAAAKIVLVHAIGRTRRLWLCWVVVTVEPIRATPVDGVCIIAKRPTNGPAQKMPEALALALAMARTQPDEPRSYGRTHLADN